MPEDRAGPGRTLRFHRPTTSRRAVVVDAEPLRLRGMPEFVVLLYLRAVEGAWEQAAQQLLANGREPGQSPPIVLRCEHPIIDPRTVRATVGIDGDWGTVTATSPGELREGLARRLAERLA